MNCKPKCIIVTGRPGSGKTTLAKKLGQQLWMPVISRDEIKEGYVNTYGIGHGQLPSETNGIVSNFFFDIVCQYLANNISVIIEAAFQHEVWEARMPSILSVGHPSIIICVLDEEIAAQRHLQRGLADPNRVFYHGDERVSFYQATGQIAPADQYVTPNFNMTTIPVLTESEYSPDLDEIAHQIRS